MSQLSALPPPEAANGAHGAATDLKEPRHPVRVLDDCSHAGVLAAAAARNDAAVADVLAARTDAPRGVLRDVAVPAGTAGPVHAGVILAGVIILTHTCNHRLS